MVQAPFETADEAKVNRWFGVEYNNEAWDLVEKPSRTADETERMVALAHAALVHWLKAGNTLNEQRAWCLLATAQTLAGRKREAVYAAEKCLALAAKNDDEQSPFDRATAHGCAMQAYAAASMVMRASEQAKLAFAAAERLDEDDRAVYTKLYGLQRTRAH